MENVKEWIFNNVSGSGYGDGSGSVYGYNSGFSDGSGFGSGAGYDSGSGLKTFEGTDVYLIDNVQTIIEHIKGAFAKGYLLNEDFTLTPCFVTKGNGYFAHGKTLKKATEALREKIFENMDSEEAIEEFMKKFKQGKKYPGTEFFEWHHYLTGSCLLGRESFIKNKGLNINDMYTVEEFIALCENDYGGNVIKQLKEVWEKTENDV